MYLAPCCADIHLSHTPPTARSSEPDWYAAMLRPLQQLHVIADGRPVVYAGDIFHTPDEPAELINFAIKHLPKGYAVAGQHDLKHHVYSDKHKTPLWTLVEAGVLKMLRVDEPEDLSLLIALHGFSWDFPITPATKTNYSIAVVHKYIWKGGHAHSKASQKEALVAYKNLLKGYKSAIFGDNHNGFDAMISGCQVFNCGCLIRRRMDERSYKPSVGLIQENGAIKRQFLDVSQDVLLEPGEVARRLKNETDSSQLIEELSAMADKGLDFKESLLAEMKQQNTPKRVRVVVENALNRA